MDYKTSYPLRREYFNTYRYNENMDQQDQRINQRDGLEPINKR
jgi:hypothetical protein